MSQVKEEIINELDEARAMLLTMLASNDDDSAAELAATRARVERGADGMVLVGLDHRPETLAMLARAGVPYELTWSLDPSGRHHCIGFSHRSASIRITQHLLDLGHREFAVIAGDTVRYVVNRNINYTNVCVFRCAFCAFSKGKTAAHLRGSAYNLDTGEIGRRVGEAWIRGATEVCMQGGIHPAYNGETYLAILRAVKNAEPEMHVHAFSPLEVWHGAQTLDLSISSFLLRLCDAGLG